MQQHARLHTICNVRFTFPTLQAVGDALIHVWHESWLWPLVNPTLHIWSVLGLALVVFALDINKHMHFVTFSLSAPWRHVNREAHWPQYFFFFCLASKMAFTSVLVPFCVCVCVYVSILRGLCSCLSPECVHLCVCMYFQYSAPCLWPCSTGALSLSDGPVRSEEGQSRQELI